MSSQEWLHPQYRFQDWWSRSSWWQSQALLGCLVPRPNSFHLLRWRCQKDLPILLAVTHVRRVASKQTSKCHRPYCRCQSLVNYLRRPKPSGRQQWHDLRHHLLSLPRIRIAAIQNPSETATMPFWSMLTVLSSLIIAAMSSALNSLSTPSSVTLPLGWTAARIYYLGRLWTDWITHIVDNSYASSFRVEKGLLQVDDV